jgi:hypothetical protein
MLKKTEVVYALISVVITAVLAYFVLTVNQDFRLEDIGLLKMFYVSLMNVAFCGFALTFRGLKYDAFEYVSQSRIATAILFGCYVIALALVIGK